MIRAENLTKYYGRQKAISNVSLQVRPGEILGFLGPNGAGKTTTIKILTGFLYPTFGTATIHGLDIFEQSREARRYIGYMPENPAFYPELTVQKYLYFHARIKGIPARQRAERVGYVLDLFKIEDVRDTLIGKLSKGYRQRVGLAQALVHDPRVVFLDEPTVGLDPRQIIDTRQAIKSLAGEHTVLLSTHILPEVSMTCDRVAIIHEGTIIAEDTPEHLTAKIKGSEIIQVEVKGNLEILEDKLKTIPGVMSLQALPQPNQESALYQINTALGHDVRAEIARCIVQNGLDLCEMRPVKLSLEDIYLKLTTEEEGLEQ